jgi:hypothetical protein
LNAEKYIGFTGAPRATVTRDLQDLVGKGALIRHGERKHTRYFLNLEFTPSPAGEGWGDDYMDAGVIAMQEQLPRRF